MYVKPSILKNQKTTLPLFLLLSLQLILIFNIYFFTFFSMCIGLSDTDTGVVKKVRYQG